MLLTAKWCGSDLPAAVCQDVVVPALEPVSAADGIEGRLAGF